MTRDGDGRPTPTPDAHPSHTGLAQGLRRAAFVRAPERRLPAPEPALPREQPAGEGPRRLAPVPAARRGRRWRLWAFAFGLGIGLGLSLGTAPGPDGTAPGSARPPTRTGGLAPADSSLAPVPARPPHRVGRPHIGVLFETASHAAIPLPSFSGAGISGGGPQLPEPGSQAVRLSVNAVPWAAIRIDGEPVGQTPLGRLALAPGSHVITASFPDGRTLHKTIRVRHGHARVAFR